MISLTTGPETTPPVYVPLPRCATRWCTTTATISGSRVFVGSSGSFAGAIPTIHALYCVPALDAACPCTARCRSSPSRSTSPSARSSTRSRAGSRTPGASPRARSRTSRATGRGAAQGGGAEIVLSATRTSLTIGRRETVAAGGERRVGERERERREADLVAARERDSGAAVGRGRRARAPGRPSAACSIRRPRSGAPTSDGPRCGTRGRPRRGR